MINISNIVCLQFYSNQFMFINTASIAQLTASIAQLVERPLSEREVVGSNPAAAPYQRCKKNGTSSSLADARIKGVVLGR